MGKSKNKYGAVSITKEDLIKHANQVHKRLEFLQKVYELNKKLKDIRVAYSKVLNPNFEFEKTKEYEEYLKEKAQYDFDYWYEMEYLPAVKQLEEDLDKTNKQIMERGE